MRRPAKVSAELPGPANYKPKPEQTKFVLKTGVSFPPLLTHALLLVFLREQRHLLEEMTTSNQ